MDAAASQHVPLRVIGKVIEQDVSIAMNGKKILAFTIDELKNAYYHSLEQALNLDEL